MITKEELDQMLVSLEQDRIEKTISTTDNDKFGQAICAFANDLPKHQKPGYLIIGAHDNGVRSGLKVDEKLLQTLMDFRTDGRIDSPISIVVATFHYNDGDVAVVEVHPSFNPPVRYKGSVCVRIGPRKGIATEADERILSEKRSSFAQTFDVLPCRESKMDDISVDIFKLTYLPFAIDPETLEANHRNLEIQLSSLKFFDLKHNCPTNAGILMFGKNPRFYMAGAYVQYVKFKGKDVTSEFDFERRFEGDLTTQLRVINDFTKTQIVKMVLPELGGQYQYNFPHIAIKELLFNAIIHRDYRSNAPIKYYEYEDRLEISNPGGLYGLATKENFPSQNDYRNPTLAEAAKKLGYINSFNIGISNARGALKKNGNLPPEFKLDQQTHFSVTIYKKQI